MNSTPKCLDSRSYRCSVDSAEGAAWDRIVESFADGVIDQTSSYAAACWGDSHLSNVILRHNDELVAACQLVIFRPPLLPGGVAYVKFGPLWQRDGKIEPEHLSQIINCLRNEYVDNRGMFLRIMPRASMAQPELLPAELTRMGFARRKVPDAERFLVSTSYSADQLLTGLKSKWRYNLKIAQRQKFGIEHSTDTPMLAHFMDLYASMRTRKAFVDSRAIKQLPAICKNLPSASKASVWLCRIGNEPVAGAIVSRIGDTALYLFGATNDRGRDSRASYVLHWSIIDALRRAGCDWYDLGGACGSAGLRQFKSGLTGRYGATPRLPGYFDMSAGALSSLAARSTFQLRQYVDSAREHFARFRPG